MYLELKLHTFTVTTNRTLTTGSLSLQQNYQKRPKQDRVKFEDQRRVPSAID